MKLSKQRLIKLIKEMLSAIASGDASLGASGKAPLASAPSHVRWNGGSAAYWSEQDGGMGREAHFAVSSESTEGSDATQLEIPASAIVEMAQMIAKRNQARNPKPV